MTNIDGTVTPKGPSSKYTTAQVEAIMSGDLAEGEHVVAIFVPSRTIRIIRSEDERTFKVQQRDMKTHKWATLTMHVGLARWEGWGVAWTSGKDAQEKLLLEVRRAKITHNRMVQHAKEGRI